MKNACDPDTPMIDVADLRIGLYVYIDSGWMSHPFPLSSFKLQSQEQIAAIRAMGIGRIRYSPEKSDPPASEQTSDVPDQSPILTPEQEERQQRRALLQTQNARLKACEYQYDEAAKAFNALVKHVKVVPDKSRLQARVLVESVVARLSELEESSIRLLSEQVGDRGSMHSVNVLVLSLLLGKASGLSNEDLHELGIGALLHDIGKEELPNRLRWNDEQFTSVERRRYQEHVGHGLETGKTMGLSNAALLCIAQHHEAANGTGFPLNLVGKKISPLASIVALTNQYDGLCNPANPAALLTPHEALSLLFTQRKQRFDDKTMAVFIRMMGVYPPGSVVQLTDGRYAMVVSVNSSRPLKPRLIIHDAQVPKEEALIVDLEKHPDLGVRRSLKPMHLPRPVLDYLSPRKRICYFFEAASATSGGEES
jgi:HD-GYP domain-containing protein (c-di-GMP phosphodiesterase class II)